ncbi:MAG TPA: SgcJ/EcaC family oxidoreductase [Gemmatimonadales bacterium]
MALAIACTRTTPVDSADTGRDRAAIDSLHQKDMRAVMAGDTTALMSLWTDDIVSLPPAGPIRSGRAANAAALRESMEQMKGGEPVEYRLDFQEVQIFGSNAFEWGTYQAVARERASADLTTTTGKVMRLLRRDAEGRWKVARTMFTVDP